MSKLEDARIIINECDKEMITLFKKRMSAAKMVAEYKASNNLPILDLKRENELIKRNTQILNDQELEGYYITFLEGMLKASKDYQEELIKEQNK